MYYMTFISRCLGMLKSRNDKLVWAKDEIKKYLRHHIIHEYDHIFRLNRHNGTTFLKKSKVGARAWFDMQYLVLWSCGWESPSQPEYYCWQIYVCPLPPPTTLLCTHTSTHKHTQIHSKILFPAKLRPEKSAQVQNTTQLCYVQKWSTWTSSMSEFISLSLQYSPPPHTHHFFKSPWRTYFQIWLF